MVLAKPNWSWCDELFRFVQEAFIARLSASRLLAGELQAVETGPCLNTGL